MPLPLHLALVLALVCGTCCFSLSREIPEVESLKLASARCECRLTNEPVPSPSSPLGRLGDRSRGNHASRRPPAGLPAIPSPGMLYRVRSPVAGRFLPRSRSKTRSRIPRLIACPLRLVPTTASVPGDVPPARRILVLDSSKSAPFTRKWVQHFRPRMPRAAEGR